MDKERRQELWLAMTAGQNPNKYWELIDRYGDAGSIYELAASGKLQHNKMEERLFTEMATKANDEYVDKCLAYMDKRGIDAVLIGDSNYPELLSEICFPPPILYVKGKLPRHIELPIAVIGSRKPTEYGEAVAAMISGELAKCGACVVSGMAYGIDSIAARAALKEGGDFPTIAVLGSGVDVIYPSENRELYEEICSRGAVVSEFLPGTKPNQGNFPRRNRIISGLSKGVVVIEAAEQSGTQITVDYALEQGRDAFAVPGRITDYNSIGTNRMIREGNAKAVFCTEDILEEYGLDMQARERVAKVDEGQLSPDELAIFKLLRDGEKSVDQLCEMTGMDMGKLNSSLTGMELSGIIKQSSGRIYGL